MRFIFVRNSRSVIGNTYFDKTVFFGCFDDDIGIFLCMFDGIIYKINDDLHDELGVDFCQEQLIVTLEGDMVLAAVTIDMMQ